MSKGKLNDQVRTYIVQANACFDSPSTVVEAVEKDYGLKITRQTVEGYDPTKKAGEKLKAKWKAIFDATRKEFVDDTSTIAVSHRAVRLRALNRMAQKAEDMGNMVLAKELLKQAAEEVGNVYSNRRELTGKDGKDLPAAPASVVVYELPSNGR